MDYYPWLSESFLGGYKKDISLAGEGNTHLMYRALLARKVYFEPVLHSNFVVRSTEPKEKKKGNHITFTYPDGSVLADGQYKPDFLKLQTIRTGRARECFISSSYDECPDRRPQLLPDWLPSPDNPGFGHYVIVDEWGEELRLYEYQLVGNSGQIFRGRTDSDGSTQSLPISAHPLREVKFPVRKW